MYGKDIVIVQQKIKVNVNVKFQGYMYCDISAYFLSYMKIRGRPR